MKDCHIHLMPLIGPEDPPAVFMAKAAEAGVAGGTIMSLPPVSFRPDPERSQHWRDRLEHIMQYTSQTPGFHPFFWIDPTEADIFSQISTAVEAGVRGFKCICNHFAPKSCLKQFSAIAETGLPIHFHSGILFDHYASGESEISGSPWRIWEIPGMMNVFSSMQNSKQRSTMFPESASCGCSST